MMKRAVAVVLVFLFTVLATHAIAAEKNAIRGIS